MHIMPSLSDCHPLLLGLGHLCGEYSPVQGPVRQGASLSSYGAGRVQGQPAPAARNHSRVRGDNFLSHW